jgi:hypothetical protein
MEWAYKSEGSSPKRRLRIMSGHLGFILNDGP